MQISKTIVINCAGIGSRLGYGHTKTLLKIKGKPIIIHHLEQLKTFEDVRIVVGFGASDVIDTVSQFRTDVTFVMNHKYMETGTLASLYLGSQHGKEQDYVVSIDGDLLIKPHDLKKFLNSSGEMLGYTNTYSDDAIFVALKKKGRQEMATSFTKIKSPYEWTGLAQIKRKHIEYAKGHVYPCLEKLLPMKVMKIESREIDTPADLERAIEWAEKIF